MGNDKNRLPVTVEGKDEAIRLHPAFHVGAKPAPRLTPELKAVIDYIKAQKAAQQSELKEGDKDLLDMMAADDSDLMGK